MCESSDTKKDSYMFKNKVPWMLLQHAGTEKREKRTKTGNVPFFLAALQRLLQLLGKTDKTKLR